MPVAAWIALAGLFFTIVLQGAGFAFFMGRLSERTATLEREAKREAGLSEKVIRLEVQLEHANEKLDAMDRTLQGVNRQLANLATGKTGFFQQGE